MAADEEEAANLDFLERDDGVVVVLGNVLSRVVPRDRVKYEETHHDGDAQRSQLGAGLGGWTRSNGNQKKRSHIRVLARVLTCVLTITDFVIFVSIAIAHLGVIHF